MIAKVSAMMIIVVLISCSIILMPGQVSADGPEVYQVEMPINASTDGALTNYAVKVLLRSGSGANTAGTIYLNGHANNWPYDIMFSDNDGTTVAHWIERYNSTEALVWVNCTSIAAAGTTVYQLSYGHGGNDTSNGSAVFPFFDDFSGDLSKWTSYNTGSPPYGTSNGIFTGTGSTGNVVKLNGNHLANGTRACRFRETVNENYASVGFEIAANTNNRQVNYGAGFLTANDAGTATNHANLWSKNAWHTFEIQVIASTSAKLYTDGALTDTQTTVGTLARPPSIYVSNPATLQLDWYLVRPFTANEPAWAAPSEETLYEPPEPPIASWTNTATSGEAPLEVVFTSTSTGATNTSWDLDDDGSFDAYGENVSWSYNSSGEVTVRMMASNDDGADWENRTLSITISSPPVDPPIIVDPPEIVDPPMSLLRSFIRVIIGLIMFMAMVSIIGMVKVKKR